MRWVEEVQLLVEEMQRFQVTCAWKSAWWLTRISTTGFDVALAEGLGSYASKQASMFERLEMKAGMMWADLVACTEEFVATHEADGYPKVAPEQE